MGFKNSYSDYFYNIQFDLSKSEVLEAMEHKPEVLLEELRIASEEAIQRGTLQIGDAQRLMEHIETSLRQSTYLHE